MSRKPWRIHTVISLDNSKVVKSHCDFVNVQEFMVL
jgi:hypothetical protein